MSMFELSLPGKDIKKCVAAEFKAASSSGVESAQKILGDHTSSFADRLNVVSVLPSHAQYHLLLASGYLLEPDAVSEAVDVFEKESEGVDAITDYLLSIAGCIKEEDGHTEITASVLPDEEYKNDTTDRIRILTDGIFLEQDSAEIADKICTLLYREHQNTDPERRDLRLAVDLKRALYNRRLRIAFLRNHITQRRLQCELAPDDQESTRYSRGKIARQILDPYGNLIHRNRDNTADLLSLLPGDVTQRLVIDYFDAFTRYSVRSGYQSITGKKGGMNEDSWHLKYCRSIELLFHALGVAHPLELKDEHKEQLETLCSIFHIEESVFQSLWESMQYVHEKFPDLVICRHEARRRSTMKNG